MSDAFTDMFRDGSRRNRILNYLSTLYKYLQGEKTKEDLIEAAIASDSTEGGWDEKTNFSGQEHMQLVDGLKNQDKESWIKFMSLLLDEDLYEQFRSISPFKNKLILIGEIECGERIELTGPGVSQIFKTIFCSEKHAHMSCGEHRFLILFDESSLEKAEGYELKQ